MLKNDNKFLSKIGRITLGMLGLKRKLGAKPKFTAKAIETRHMLPFVIKQLSRLKVRDAFLSHGLPHAPLLRACIKLQRCMRGCHMKIGTPHVQR